MTALAVAYLIGALAAFAVAVWRGYVQRYLELIERADEVKAVRDCEFCEEPGITKTHSWRYRCSGHLGIQPFHQDAGTIALRAAGIAVLWPVAVPVIAVNQRMQRHAKRVAQAAADRRAVERLLDAEYPT